MLEMAPMQQGRAGTSTSYPDAHENDCSCITYRIGPLKLTLASHKRTSPIVPVLAIHYFPGSYWKISKLFRILRKCKVTEKIPDIFCVWHCWLAVTGITRCIGTNTTENGGVVPGTFNLHALNVVEKKQQC
jgi:hypothetical protein